MGRGRGIVDSSVYLYVVKKKVHKCLTLLSLVFVSYTAKRGMATEERAVH